MTLCNKNNAMSVDYLAEAHRYLRTIDRKYSRLLKKNSLPIAKHECGELITSDEIDSSFAFEALFAYEFEKADYKLEYEENLNEDNDKTIDFVIRDQGDALAFAFGTFEGRGKQGR